VVRDNGRPGDDARALVISPSLTPGWRSGRHTGPGRSSLPVIEAADAGDPIAPHGQDLPALGRSARLASGRRAGDFQPHQECPGAGGHLRDHGSCTGGSRAGPPRDDRVAVAAVGVVGTLRRAQRAPGSSRSLMASRSPDSKANLTRSVSAAGSWVALALSGMRISPALHSWPFQRRCAGRPSGEPSRGQPGRRTGICHASRQPDHRRDRRLRAPAIRLLGTCWVGAERPGLLGGAVG
jgi:hypothetical protein